VLRQLYRVDPLPPIAFDPLRRKVAWRILPLMVILYLVSYLDRANVAFAKLRMASDLNFSDEVFGFGIGIFFIGYLVLEIPGALLVERWSARKWFTRILITWGTISGLTAFVHTPTQFYAARFFLGVAEAGYFPGMIVYFSHWFTQADRTRALSILLLAVPISLSLGAPLSGLLLDVHWLGLEGWRWLFIVEALPAIGLGIFVFCWMTDRPADAKWLEPAERTYLTKLLEAEARAKEGEGKISVWQALRLRNVWLLILGIFAANTGGYALGFWLPTTIKHLSGASDRMTLFYTSLYYGVGVISVLVSGYSSDRTGERKWHAVGGMVGTGVFLCCSAITSQTFAVTMMWLLMTSLAGYFWASPFWTLPTLTLNASAAAVAIGMINMAANFSGYVGNHLTGFIREHGASESECLLLLAGCCLSGGVFLSFLKTPRGLSRLEVDTATRRAEQR